MDVHVLEVESHINPELLTRVDRSMSNPFYFGKVDIDSPDCRYKESVRDNQRAYSSPLMKRIECRDFC